MLRINNVTLYWLGDRSVIFPLRRPTTLLMNANALFSLHATDDFNNFYYYQSIQNKWSNKVIPFELFILFLIARHGDALDMGSLAYWPRAFNWFVLKIDGGCSKKTLRKKLLKLLGEVLFLFNKPSSIIRR